MKAWTYLSILLSFLLTGTLSKLIIYYPHSLRNKIDKNHGVVHSSLANFGNIPYGHSIIGRVWYDENNIDGCKKFDMVVTGIGDPDAEPSPIVIVKRGNCPFVKKVRNVEHAGGTLAIIVDNKNERAESVVMVDDGSGNGINIPSMLVPKDQGDLIIEEVRESVKNNISGVSLLARFELPSPDNRVEYDFWYSSSNDEALDFIKNFASYHEKFREDVKFTPRYVTLECEKCPSAVKERHCFGDGKYCYFHHDNVNFTGQQIMYENLRQMCLHKMFQKKHNEMKWWEYMTEVHISCGNFINSECSAQELAKLAIDYETVEKCVNDTFVDFDHAKSKNTALEKEAHAWKTSGPYIFPAIVINKVTYKGFLHPENVFNAICEGFKDMPDECKYAKSSSKVNIVKGIDMSVVFLIIIAVIGCNIALLVLYRRHQRKQEADEMKNHAASAVNQYFAIQNRNMDTENLTKVNLA